MTSKKKKKEGGDIVSGPSSKSSKSNLLGVMVDSSFLAEVDAAAERCGLTRSNFVRKAIADAVRAHGGVVDNASAVSYQGQQTAPKEVVNSRIASARAVKAWKQSLPSRHEPWMVKAIIQTWDTAAAKIGRKLTVAELEQCERECVMLAKMADESKGPPIFRQF